MADASDSPAPQGPNLLQDYVITALEELERRSPPAEFVTLEWLDKTRAEIDGVLSAMAEVIERKEPNSVAQEPGNLNKVLSEVVRESWAITEKQLRPKAWVEKFYAAETDEDRRRIFYWALDKHCLDLKRKRRVEERLFTSLDELEAGAEATAEAPGARRSPRRPPRPPSASDNLELGLLKEKLRQAMLGLPIQLAVIAYLMPGADGNASKLARYLDIPQRQMARHLARIRAHFKKYGLES